MTTISHHCARISAVAAAAILLAAPLGARADTPDASGAQAAQAKITGTIADFHGKYGVVVRDDRGALVDVVLHQGTIIEPVGLRLERGMRVTISGAAHDRTLAANRIDTPYKPHAVARLGPNKLPGDDGQPWAPTMSVHDNRGSTNPGNVPTRPEGTSEAPASHTPQ
ncbi:MAG: hypothetical protein QOJ39_1683 [Candidatus Eremiobacteraeota bacterium]|jgi:hypothetical protein|nr:hypothetical protein [Candidatus Eremiobacteraeota bacterium]